MSTCTWNAAREGGPAATWKSGGMTKSCRGRWNPVNIALMVGGFVLFWPLGLAMLAYILWGERIRAAYDDMRAKGGPVAAFGMTGSSGNSAFDEYRAATLARLEDERRKLEAEQEAFGEFLRHLRRAKDKEEFDRFMADRRRPDATDAPATA